MTKTSKNELAENLRDGIEDATDRAADAAHAHAENAVETATQHAEDKAMNAARAAEAASGEFEPGSLQAQAADQLAQGLHQVAGQLRNTDLNKAASQVSQFARENPALFLGGAALLGFAAARFLKASDRTPTVAARPSDDPWTGHVTEAPSTPQPVRTGDPMSRGYANGSAAS